MITSDPKPITVKELIEYLKTFDENLEVINTRYSDYDYLSLDEITIVKAIPKIDAGYVMRYRSNLYHENDWRLVRGKKYPTKEYLHLKGN